MIDKIMTSKGLERMPTRIRKLSDETKSPTADPTGPILRSHLAVAHRPPCRTCDTKTLQ
jgi:hypothetical protein